MATMADKQPLFLDTNVLIYASIKQAPEYQTVRSFVENHLSRKTPLFISRQVLREYLSVLSRFQPNFDIIPKQTLILWLNAWRQRCQILDDNAAVMDTLLNLYATTSFAGKQVHDANIVATLFSHDLDTLVTANTRDFARFKPRLKLIDPRQTEI